MNGINTMNHERMVRPPMHNWFNKMVKIIITMTFKKALFCCPLNKSITIWIIENPRYRTAGGHNESIIIFNPEAI